LAFAQAVQDSRPLSTATPESPAGKATIYVYREKAFVGAAAYEKLLVNGTFLVALHNGRYASTDVPPGTVVFSVLPAYSKVLVGYAAVASLEKEATEVLRVDVEAGNTYYVKRYIAGAKARYKLVDAAPGAKEMSKLEPAKEGDLRPK